ncbi:unnamed protein product [Rhizoctonia solani]|uniref:RNA recognition motif protein, putative n=1 Tax=Rhizoctonia solani AG-3 Rhs1AP TaxID=1086054 RepID=X8J2R4_9AGAM|nr:RNA recognition motif protein, putative [Rhizoctonia solani AG-3 Rhs1AP]CAE6422444.1 unnamed protein product [Rhizoctonia solani]
MVYNAVFMTYLLLSNFELIGEKERWAVELIVELSASYDLDLGRIDMSRDVFGKVRILLPQLCVLAARYGYMYTETEIGFNSAHCLLLAIVKPLVGHLCPYEHREIKSTVSDAYDLLDLSLPKLRPLVQQWYSNNFEVVLQTTPLPRSGQPRVTEHEPRVLRIRNPRAKRYGWTPAKTCEELNAEKLKGSLNLSLRLGERPKLFQFRSTHVSKEELARREWPLSPVTLCSVSTDSQGPSTPSNWDESFESMGSDENSSSLFGQRLKKGLKAFFSNSS